MENSSVNPYQGLGEMAFWATAVAKKNMFDIGQLWEPGFDITQGDAVATFGSCFAQHFGRALAAKGFHWMDAEPAPELLSADSAAKFNYGVFSARTGNIYTVSLLRQWVQWATGRASPPEEVWEQGGRFYDPFRPNIEPNGFASVEELRRSRDVAIAAFRDCLETSDVFVFTLGLTESWVNAQDGYEYPMCPGTVAGEFDGARHSFVNQEHHFIRRTLLGTLKEIRTLNRRIRFLLTVSPVPLTATMSGRHVLVATMESKSILRAVAGNISRHLDQCDYFPSYEIINSTPYRGTFFEANQRNVNSAGVAHVMAQFFACMNARFPITEEEEVGDKPGRSARNARLAALAMRQTRDGAGRPGVAPTASASAVDKPTPAPPRRRATASRHKEVCEEELLAAFANQGKAD